MSAIRRTFMRLLKRIDNTQWNFTPQPAGIRYLTDEQGNVLALLVTQINPNQAEPLTPVVTTAVTVDGVVLNIQLN